MCSVIQGILDKYVCVSFSALAFFARHQVLIKRDAFLLDLEGNSFQVFLEELHALNARFYMASSALIFCSFSQSFIVSISRGLSCMASLLQCSYCSLKR